MENVNQPDILLTKMDEAYLSGTPFRDFALAESPFARKGYAFVPGGLIMTEETRPAENSIDVLVVGRMDEWRKKVFESFFADKFDHAPVVRYAEDCGGNPCHSVMVCLKRGDIFAECAEEGESNAREKLAPAQKRGYVDRKGVTRLLLEKSPLESLKRPEQSRLELDMKLQLSCAWRQAHGGEKWTKTEILFDEVPF